MGFRKTLPTQNALPYHRRTFWGILRKPSQHQAKVMVQMADLFPAKGHGKVVRRQAIVPERHDPVRADIDDGVSRGGYLGDPWILPQVPFGVEAEGEVWLHEGQLRLLAQLVGQQTAQLLK